MALAPMDENIKQLLAAFNTYSVRYVVVGGYAVLILAKPRATKDLDLLIEPSPTNVLATYKALANFGAPLIQLTVEDFADGKPIARSGNPPLCVYAIQRIVRIDFATNIRK